MWAAEPPDIAPPFRQYNSIRNDDCRPAFQPVRMRRAASRRRGATRASYQGSRRSDRAWRRTPEIADHAGPYPDGLSTSLGGRSGRLSKTTRPHADRNSPQRHLLLRRSGSREEGSGRGTGQGPSRCRSHLGRRGAPRAALSRAEKCGIAPALPAGQGQPQLRPLCLINSPA